GGGPGAVAGGPGEQRDGEHGGCLQRRGHPASEREATSRREISKWHYRHDHAASAAADKVTSRYHPCRLGWVWRLTHSPLVCQMTHQLQEQAVAKRFYPAVLERCPKKTFAVWFPDFPGCVAAGLSQEQALEKAEQELAAAMEREQPLPTPTPFERIEIPDDCDVITLCVIGAEAPDASERVNVYLSKSLLERADRKAAEMGMNRS